MQNSLVSRDVCLEVVWNVRPVRIESIGILNLLIVNVHFNIWKYRIHYVVYIGNSSYFFLFFFVLCSCFSENNRLIFVLLFLFRTLECIVTRYFEKFELQCQKRLSQINVTFPFRLKFQFYAVFIKWGSWINSCTLEDRTSSTIGTFPPRFPDTATKGWCRKLLFDMINEKCL